MGAHSRSLQERVSRGRGSEGGPRAHRIKQPALTLGWASLVAQMGKSLPTMPEAWVPSLGREDPLEKGGSDTTEQLTHTHTHAGTVPSDNLRGTHTHTHTRRHCPLG